MVTSARKVYQVAVVRFNGAEILDFPSSIEILTYVYYHYNPHVPEPAFTIHVIAETPTVRAGGSLTFSADMTFQEASKRQDDIDIMIVPGSPPGLYLGLLKETA